MGYDKKQFAERLKEICLLKTNNPQKELEALTKKKQSSVFDWLNGNSLPNEENLLKIVIWGGTTSDYLLFARGPKTREGDEVEDQLLYFYRHLTKPRDRIEFVEQCNWIFSKMEPAAGVANPFGGVPREPPKPPIKPPAETAMAEAEPPKRTSSKRTKQDRRRKGRN